MNTIENTLERANERLRVEMADLMSQIDDLTEARDAALAELSGRTRELEETSTDHAMLRCRDRIDTIVRTAVLVGRFGHGNVADAEDVLADMADQALTDLGDFLKGGVA